MPETLGLDFFPLESYLPFLPFAASKLQDCVRPLCQGFSKTFDGSCALSNDRGP